MTIASAAAPVLTHPAFYVSSAQRSCDAALTLLHEASCVSADEAESKVAAAKSAMIPAMRELRKTRSVSLLEQAAASISYYQMTISTRYRELLDAWDGELQTLCTDALKSVRNRRGDDDTQIGTAHERVNASLTKAYGSAEDYRTEIQQFVAYRDEPSLCLSAAETYCFHLIWLRCKAYGPSLHVAPAPQVDQFIPDQFPSAGSAAVSASLGHGLQPSHLGNPVAQGDPPRYAAPARQRWQLLSAWLPTAVGITVGLGVTVGVMCLSYYVLPELAPAFWRVGPYLFTLVAPVVGLITGYEAFQMSCTLRSALRS